MLYCKNCGHESHCGIPLKKEMWDGERLPIEIEICKSCSCSECNNSLSKKKKSSFN